MKKLFFLLILLAAATACFGNVSEDRLRKFENYMDEVQKAYHIPGMALVITSAEETLFEKKTRRKIIKLTSCK